MELTVASLQSQVKRHVGELAAAVDATTRDAGFHEALRSMALFWRYSVRNQVLIHIQQKGAVRVQGRLAWEAAGRKVKTGEEPLWVLAPSRGQGGSARYVAVPVYDVKQTRGRALRELDLSLAGRTRHWRTMERAAAAMGIEVAYVPLEPPLRGRSCGMRIEVLPGLRGQERTSVLAHELAHEVLHQAERRRRETMKRPGPMRTHAELETEAEATAYVVLSVLGLPSKAPTYIAWQGGTGHGVLRSMTRVQRAVRGILDAASRTPMGAVS